MNKLWIGKLLCKLGFHKRHTIKTDKEVNWIVMNYSIIKCVRCHKIF